jgi:hypothetical protein
MVGFGKAGVVSHGTARRGEARRGAVRSGRFGGGNMASSRRTGADYSLYGGHPPHERQSDTSHGAATEIRPHIGRLQSLVLYWIREAGQRGLTDDELEQTIHRSHQTVSARRRELVLLNLVTDSGRRRRTRSGRRAAVWVIKKPSKY